MNIDQCASRLGVKDPKAVKRARKILRKLDDYHSNVKLPCSSARDAACLYISCKLHGEPMDTGRIARYSGAGEGDFMKTATVIQNLVKVKIPEIKVSDLCERYGGKAEGAPTAMYLTTEVTDLLTLFRSRCPGASLSSIHTCAALYLIWVRDAPKKLTEHISEKEMSLQSHSDLPRFKDTLDLIETTVPEVHEYTVTDTVVEEKKKKKKDVPRGKPKRRLEEPTATASEAKRPRNLPPLLKTLPEPAAPTVQPKITGFLKPETEK
eukprot:TRINITY_DN3105_c1_g4_i1.p1 TRINITY_DN3105_c1_g4~~TRINITY_DN3105_c1_g4_i1.p1  ORF type:complete len:265 (+),score=18.72 TRINITY_DN3105_c1_g4_i1:31-825(+)